MNPNKPAQQPAISIPQPSPYPHPFTPTPTHPKPLRNAPQLPTPPNATTHMPTSAIPNQRYSLIHCHPLPPHDEVLGHYDTPRRCAELGGFGTACTLVSYNRTNKRMKGVNNRHSVSTMKKNRPDILRTAAVPKTIHGDPNVLHNQHCSSPSPSTP